MKSTLPLVLLILLLAPGSAVHACDCVSVRALSSAVRTEAPFIFEGTVIEIVERTLQTSRITSGGGSSESKALGREVVFAVRRAWNGVAAKRMTVEAAISDCMFPFEIDHTYVVFASKGVNGAPSSSACSRTMESSKAADVLARLGAGTVPR